MTTHALQTPPKAPDDEAALLARDHLVVHQGAEIHTKSSRTQRRFFRLLVEHLEAAVRRAAPDARVIRRRRRIHVAASDLDRAAEAAATVFGVHRVTRVRPLRYASLDELADQVGALTIDQVRGRTFAVRTRRRGHQGWTSEDANKAIAERVWEGARGVDLRTPEVEIKVEVYPEVAHLVMQRWTGPDGLPMGSQERALSLMSGGFDSPVAAWLMMRRGCTVDYVHFKLECSQSEHALVVAHALHERWGGATRPLLWMVDFQHVKQALLDHVDSRVRQVILKRMMIATADALARRLGVHALVTGEAVGQVSSQTLSHLAAIDEYCSRSVLRPLAGYLKQEIIDLAREVGTEAISARAVEVCDLSDGPVNVTARWAQLARGQAALPPDLVEAAMAQTTVVALDDWLPGVELVPVVPTPPEGVPTVDYRDPLPEEGPVAVTGRGAGLVASGLRRRGRQVWVVLAPPSA